MVISFMPRQEPIPVIMMRAGGMPQALPFKYSTANEATVMSEDITAGVWQAVKKVSRPGYTSTPNAT